MVRKTRIKLIHILGKIKANWSVNFLIKELQTDNENIKIAAAKSLGMIKDSRAVETLISKLNTESRANDKVISAIAWSLGELKDTRAIVPLIRQLSSLASKQEPKYSLIKIGEPAVQPLIDELKADNVWGIELAINTLGMLGNSMAIGPLLVFAIKKIDFENSNWKEDDILRRAAREALSKIKAPRTIKQIITIVNYGEKYWDETETASNVILKKIMEEFESGHTDNFLNMIKQGFNINADLNGKTVLSLACGCESENINIVNMLFNNGYDLNVANYNSEVIQIACKNGHFSILQKIFEKADNNAIIKEQLISPPSLKIACEKGFSRIAKLLIEKGANVEFRNSNEYDTPLIVAARNGHDEVVTLLINFGADVNAVVTREIPELDIVWQHTPLILATSSEYAEVVKILLRKGADVSFKCGKEAESAILIACKNGYVEIVKQLLDNGADINDTTYDNFHKGDISYPHSGLMLACIFGHIEIVKLLLERKANVDITDSNGNTALSYAIKNEFLEIVNLIKNT